MVNWKVLFALSESQTEEIGLADVADLVDWDPEFQGKLISSFFDTDYHWLLALRSVHRDDVTFPSKNFLLVVGRKWGEDKEKGVPLGVLFEFSEGDLKLRAVGPQSVAEKAGGDNNLLLDLVNELFDFPQKWRSKSVICGISKEEWRSIAEIIGEEPWRLIDVGRNFMLTETKKATENFQKAFKIFTVLADLNGQFHAMLALLEVALETKNGTMWMMQRLEEALFSGNADIISQAFNGINKQLIDGYADADTAGDGLPDTSLEHVMDLRGKFITESHFRFSALT